MKIDDVFIESGYTDWKNATDTKKASINMKSQRFIVPAVNRFVEVPSSTDDIVGTVTKNLLEIQQKKIFSFNENYK